MTHKYDRMFGSAWLRCRIWHTAPKWKRQPMRRAVGFLGDALFTVGAWLVVK